MKAILWTLVILTCGAALLSRYVAIGRRPRKTMAETRRDSFGGVPPRYRITQPGRVRKQWLRIERRRKVS